MSGFGPLASYPLAASGGDSPADLTASAGAAGIFIGTRRRLDELTTTGDGATAALPQLWPLLVSSAAATDGWVSEALANLRARAQAQGVAAPVATYRRDLAGSASFTDAIHAAWMLLLEDAGEVAATPEGTVRKLVAIAEAIAALGHADGRLTAYAAVAVAGALEARASAGWSAEAAAQAELTGEAAAILQVMLSLADSLAATDTAQGSLLLSLVASDGAQVGDDLASTLRSFADLDSDAALYCSFRLGASEYHGWVFNSDLRAVTEYRNARFDSIALFRGTTYAAGEDGIYSLRGDTDDGAKIDAWLKPFLTDFGTQQFKRVPDIWVGVDTSGRMFVKVHTRDPRTGAATEDWYPVVQSQAAGPAPGRVQVGRGLKSTWWGLTLQNEDGADFSLDSIAWRPLNLDRRQ